MNVFFLILFGFFFHPLQLPAASLSKKTVLVVGGAGFIGSHVNMMLQRCGYSTVVLDNLSQGNRENVIDGIFIEGDIHDSALLDQIFSSYKIDAVMHFAAFIEVGESVKDPLKYYENNVSNTINLLNAMRRHHVNVFIFSSSATVYGNSQEKYLSESLVCQPTNPYGQTKLMTETILKDLDHAYGLRYCCLRYFNASGGDPEGKIKNRNARALNLIPVVLQSLKKTEAFVTIFGTDYPTRDGTCIRDYIHIEDLGSAHILAMKKLLEGAPSNCYNLGNGRGYSVREVIEAVEKVTGMRVNIIEGPRRMGDPNVLIANSHKAKDELHWQPKYFLEEIIQHAWNAMQTN